jgi:divalent metal cation (Fe/Co/Zn/Cd) transporter
MNIVAGDSTKARHELVSRGLRLEYICIFYNSLEGVVALVSGLVAGSIALIGFGLDSVIELFSSLALIWRLHSDSDKSRRERSDLLSLRIVGCSFLCLAAYVSYDAIKAFLYYEQPEKSVPGIILAILSVIIMPLISRAKRKVALGMESNAMRADAKQTEFCAYLSAILLSGLLLNALLGWWWTDPLAALVMVPIISKEGIESLQGKNCSCTDSSCGPT